MRPQGLLINLQPYARPLNLQGRRGDDVRQAGSAMENDEKLRDMKASLRELEESGANGLFALRREEHWQFEMRYRTIADWQEFLERPRHGGVEADQELLDAALPPADGSVFSTEDDLA